jgi:hypothetical protein
MKTFCTLVLLLGLSGAVLAQTNSVPAPAPAATVTQVPEVKLPAYVGFGIAANQLGTSRWNLWGSAIYALDESKGLYLSSTADAFPVKKLDPTTNRMFWSASTSFRQGVHKLVYRDGKNAFLIGGDAGIGLSQQSPTGSDFSFSGGFTGTYIREINSRWSVMVPIRGLYISGNKLESNWNVVPQIGFMFRLP